MHQSYVHICHLICQAATNAYETITSELFGSSADQVTAFKSSCHKSFQYATIFRELKPEEVTNWKWSTENIDHPRSPPPLESNREWNSQQQQQQTKSKFTTIFH